RAASRIKSITSAIRLCSSRTRIAPGLTTCSSNRSCARTCLPHVAPSFMTGLCTLMAQVRLPDAVLLIVAAFSRYPELLARSRDELEHAFGPVALASQPYDFVQTKYYEATMGPGLRKH